MKIIKTIKYFLKSIKSGIKYFKIGYNTCSFDYGFLLEIERTKIEEMYNYFKDADISEDDWIVARDCKLALNLLDIITERISITEYKRKDFNECKDIEDYLSNIEFTLCKYVNEKNADRFFNETELANLSEKNKKIYPITCESLYIEKAWHLYNMLRENNMRRWYN